MRIAYVIPGSGGGFYCENCYRDVDLIRAIRELGHEVFTVPMYLPSRSEDDTLDAALPIFFGAVSTYLNYRFPFLKRTPSWLTRLLDSPPVLGIAAKRAGSTRAASLGEMTLSLLRGEEGPHASELERMVSWVREELKPDVLHLSNALLLGLVRRVRQTVPLSVACSLQDEHTWVDVLAPPYEKLVWEELARRAADVDVFVPVSRFYADEMKARMNIPENRIRVNYTGVVLGRYTPQPLSFSPPVIGFLSRISKPQGIEVLAEAFIHLKRELGFRDCRLRISGGHTGDDKKTIHHLKSRFRRFGLLEDVEIVPGFGTDDRIEFLRSLTVLSVPVLSGPAFGSYLIEAMAMGVPVVQPELGAFPELIGETGGGILYTPNDPASLAGALHELLSNRERAVSLGKAGCASVRAKLCIEHTARRMLDIYRTCTG
jgi:glycosyltransferase involved in cell wall biosynthesis